MNKLFINNRGIQIELTPYEIIFTKESKFVASPFCIPVQFSDIAVEFYDLIIENGVPTVIISCRKDYDIAIQLNEKTGTMIDWHFFK